MAELRGERMRMNNPRAIQFSCVTAGLEQLLEEVAWSRALKDE